MYVVIVYDVDALRVGRINKFLKRYLIWVQNSVFEGDITDTILSELLKKLKKMIEGKDSFIIYKFRAESYVVREIVGFDFDRNNNVI
ncbi:MAG: CRISPR-associated endonuclease Cas2 [Thermoplasmataceae archaeon]